MRTLGIRWGVALGPGPTLKAAKGGGGVEETGDMMGGGLRTWTPPSKQ